ncbi:MAG: TonB-dependent receptor [Sphingobacteriia bacterium]|nr:TonB-dependent receptor [Sphingobacteriia bacterium]
MFKKLLSIVTILVLSLHGFAQETAATLTGSVTDTKGAIIPGAIIAVKHEPTGFTVTAQTNKRGLFAIPNLKPGGPYTIKISNLGFKEEVYGDINLTLGANPDLNVVLRNSTTELKEVTVTAGGKKAIAGATTIGGKQLQTLPTLGRSLSDFTRMTPQSNNNSFAGSNFRYNNITIDGAINNDAIGFSNSFGGVSGGGQSGAAGAGTRTNPYSIDVIQEVQVQLSPYDVKLGNFTGGSVNAVTKSGTNDIHGSIYGYGRNQVLVGKSVDGQKKSIGSDFYDYQYGATVSGPIVKNKVFFIFNYEQTRRQEPTFYNIGDPGQNLTLADATSIYNQLAGKGYDAGVYQGAYKIFTNSNKYFGRLDFNLSKSSTLTIRGIYTKGWGNNLERTSTNFQFGSTDFTQYTNNLNLAAELKSKLSNDVNNQLIVSYIKVHEYRDFPGKLGPFMDITYGSENVWVGSWREASIYNMKQSTFEITDNLTLTKGINKFTIGTHNEVYDLSYGFVNSWNGRWQYGSLTNFLNDVPSRIRSAFTLDPTKYPNSRDYLYNNAPYPYNVYLLSAYAQDEISVNKNFKITPGIRIDYSTTGSNPPIDPALNNMADYVSANPTYTHTSFKDLNGKWLGTPTFSPRVGFNYDIKGDGKLVLRGGSGVFIGRVPFAWLGYGYTLNGNVYGNIDTKPGKYVPLAVDPNSLKDTVSKYMGPTASSTREVDIVDNKFKLPTIWRSNIAFDYKFGKGYKLTVDFMYTKVINDVKFQQINIKDSTQYFSTGPTLSPVYVGGKLNGSYSNVYHLKNTSEGFRYNATAQISKTTNNIKVGSHLFNLNWSAAYTYGMSKDIANGIRNSWQSNYEVNPAISMENAALSYSNFDLRHRIVGTISGQMLWNDMNSTSLAFFYSGQSGSPYSVIYVSGPFNNAGNNADLPYIPNNISDINLASYTLNGVSYSAAQQWADLDNFIRNDKYLSKRRGQYAERNGLRTPWNHNLDMKLMHEFKLSKSHKSQSIQVSLDVFNVLNLINNDWGHINFVTNVNNYTVNFLKFVNDANGKAPGAPSTGYIPTFNFLNPSGAVGSAGHYYTADPINSRWQGQLGVKYNF